MKKLLVIILLVILVHVYRSNALAEEITICPNCSVTSSGHFCPECGQALAEEFELAPNESILNIRVTYEKNKLFAKYDVKVYVGETLIGILKQGETLNKTIVVPNGILPIYIVSQNDAALIKKDIVLIAENSTLSFSVKAHKFFIDILDMNGNCLMSDAEKAAYNKSVFIADCVVPDYEDVCRYPSKYILHRTKVEGRVIATAQTMTGVQKFVVKDTRNNLWHIQYNPGNDGPRVLVDDRIAVYGTFSKISSFKSNTVTYSLLPTVSLSYMEID